VKREKIDDFVAIELDLASDVSRHRATAHKLGIALSDKQEHLDCGICMDRSATSVMVPCGHSFCCTPPCHSFNLTTCPVCSKPIEHKMRVVAPVWDQLPRIKIKIDEFLTRPVRSKNSKAGKQKSSQPPPVAAAAAAAAAAGAAAAASASSSSGEGAGGKGRGLAKNREVEAAQSQKQRDEKTGVERTERQLADNALAQHLIKLAHVKVHPNARHFDHSNHMYVCVCVCARVCVCWSCVYVIPTKGQALWVWVCVGVCQCGYGCVCVCVGVCVCVRAHAHTPRAHMHTLLFAHGPAWFQLKHLFAFIVILTPYGPHLYRCIHNWDAVFTMVWLRLVGPLIA